MSAKTDTMEEAKPTRPKVRWWYLSGFLIALVLFVGSTMLARHGTLTGWEYPLLTYLNGWSDSWRTFFLAATIAPNALWFGMASVIVAYIVKFYYLAWQLAAAIIASVGLSFITKEVIGRARPGDLVEAVHVRVLEQSPGFPSLHTAMITVIVLTILPYTPKGWRWVCLLLIPLMAWSRIYLGVHAPLDVIGGFGLGLGIVCAMHLLPRVIRKIVRFS